VNRTKPQYGRLLEPIDVGGITLRNRVVKAPQDTHFVGPDGRVEERVVALYEALARGGVGLVVLASVPPIAMAPEARQIAIWDDEFIPGLARVAEAVHRHGARIVVQLNHGGPAEVDHYPSGRAWSASTLEAENLPSPAPHFKPVRGLDHDEVLEVELAYIRAAERAFAAGYDGVEVHAAHTYLLGSFLTRIWNRRTDEYGPGTGDSRTLVVRNIIRGIRERVGDGFIVGVRLNGIEFGTPGALTSVEAVENAVAIDAVDPAYISVTGYGHGPVPFKYVPDYWRYPEPQPDMEHYVAPTRDEGLLIPAAAAIKEAVRAPVIGVGGLTPATAARAIEDGRVDLVALGRALWADHDLVNKVASGRIADVRPCTRCATCEVSPRKCRVNAALGSTDDYVLRHAETRKRVVVVGGGPAGMEAARVAAERGHSVVLFEKERRLGGMLPLAVMVKGTETEDILGYRDYLTRQLDVLGVDVRLGSRVTVEGVRDERPDAIVVATGGRYRLPDIPGIEATRVTTTAQLAHHAALPLRILGPRVTRGLTRFYLPFGRRVVVIGARIEGVETAEFLVKHGREVTILDTDEAFGEGMPARLLMRLVAWFEQEGVDVHTGVRFEEITDNSVRFITAQGRPMTADADDIVVAVPRGPDSSVADSLADLAPEVHAVGPESAARPWLIVDAVAGGFSVGSRL
jgi:2,4-dienoyl-CoA reductase (NADPH2)